MNLRDVFALLNPDQVVIVTHCANSPCMSTKNFFEQTRANDTSEEGRVEAESAQLGQHRQVPAQ